jgi:hypothetical protein
MLVSGHKVPNNWVQHCYCYCYLETGNSVFLFLVTSLGPWCLQTICLVTKFLQHRRLLWVDKDGQVWCGCSWLYNACGNNTLGRVAILKFRVCRWLVDKYWWGLNSGWEVQHSD